MTQAALEILHRDEITEGGFAGLREHRLVQGRKLWGLHADPATWDGVGNFVYLADARFNPHGDTRMHPHHEIDVISVMVEGRIAHEGSLEHGSALDAHDVQVQRAGGMAYLAKGAASVGGQKLAEGDLVRGGAADIFAEEDSQLVLVSLAD